MIFPTYDRFSQTKRLPLSKMAGYENGAGKNVKSFARVNTGSSEGGRGKTKKRRITLKKIREIRRIKTGMESKWNRRNFEVVRISFGPSIA